MTIFPLASDLPSQGFQFAVLLYIVAGVVSFAASASIYWRRRRQAGRHTACALLLALFVAAMQILVIASFWRIRVAGYEHQYFRDTMLTTAIVLLPAFFISAFVMAAAGAWISERNRMAPFPVARGLVRGEPARWKVAAETVLVSVVAGGVALAYSIGLFVATERALGHPPQPAPGTEDVAHLFEGRALLVLGFGLAAAFWEEIFVRLFLQNALIRLFRNARGGTACAIGVASFIWAAGHAGTMNPELVKFLQVFFIGLLLGFLCVRRGVEATLLAHSSFNIGILIVGGFQ